SPPTPARWASAVRARPASAAATAAGSAGPSAAATKSAATASVGPTTPVSAAAVAAATVASIPTAATVALGARRRRGREVCEVRTGVALGHDFALVDPALDADAAERRARLVEAVVDVGAHPVQRHATV